MSKHALFDGWVRKLAAGGPTRGARIVFAEGDDPRVQQAARELGEYGISPVLVCAADSGAPVGLDCVGVADLAAGQAGARIDEVAALRGWPEAQRQAYRHHPVFLAAALVDTGAADGCVAGTMHPTSDVLRAGIHVLGLLPDTRVLSSSFLMLPATGSPLAFADCAVVPEPDDSQLADIAISTAQTFANLTGARPSVAMLSFSTKGSADHDAAQRVRAATDLVRRRAPELPVDGEIQFDAALVASIGDRKAPGSPVAGNANVFVFPNLSAGNIGYKIAERLGGAQAIGPLIQGVRAPLHDLSRGCCARDIVNVAVISALQARARAEQPVAEQSLVMPG